VTVSFIRPVLLVEETETTDLPQVADKLYHIEITLVLLPLILQKLKKAKLKIVHSNKGIKHSEDFDKKKFKHEYLGRIFMNSHVWILFFINSHLTIISW
jgi:hypothetical protein